MADETAGTGVAELDRALGGLYWGDNVVWVWEGGGLSSQALFYDAIARRREDFGTTGYIVASSDPAEVRARWPWIEILDVRMGSPITSPRGVLEAIRQFCVRARRPLLLFDSLEALSGRWGMRTASDFFGRCCPMLLDLGAIAYWSVPGASQYRTLHREIEQITQCVIVVGEGRVRISKAEGRPPGVQGQLFRYSVQDGTLQLEPAQAVARVGAALRAYRLRRELSQSDLARLAQVSPSAISQVERGERGLSLETLLALAGRLNITLDELLGGEVTPDYRIGRRPSSPCRDRRPSRLLSPTRAPSSSGWSAASCRCWLDRAGRSCAAVRRFSPPAAGSTPGATSERATRTAYGCCGTERINP